MKKLGLIGYPLGHSFSKKYYLQKMADEGITGIDYDLYPIEKITDFPRLCTTMALDGCNVTIPYKERIIPYLDALSEEAASIGAVNCIRIQQNGDDGRPFLKGYNTDAYGFAHSFMPHWKPDIQTRALVLGTGGAAKAVVYVLHKLGIETQLVSRTASENMLSYATLSPATVREYRLIINCTPLGTFPHVDDCPPIPYDAIGTTHYLYDLIYNPQETRFLRNGRLQGAMTRNGYDMLVLQAEKNWEIWLQD